MSVDSGRGQPSHSDFFLYRYVVRQAAPHWLSITGLFLLSLLASPLALLAPVPLKIVVDNALGGRPLPRMLAALLPAARAHSVTAILLLAVSLLLATALVTQGQTLATSFLGAFAAEKLVLDFRTRLFQHVQRLSISYHDHKGSADSIYRIQWDAQALQYITIDGFIPFVSALCTILGMLWVSARLDWQLALVAVAISPILLQLSRKYRPLLRDQSERVKKLESSALSVVHEVISALRVVKAFGREEHEQERYVRESTKGMQARLRLALAEGRYGMLVGLSTTVGMCAVLWLGARHVQQGLLSLGDLFLVMAYLGQLYEPLKIIGRKSASLQGHLTSIERAIRFLNESPDVTERPHARPVARSSGAIQYRDVSFAYRGEHHVLHDISFEIPAGARVGVVGKTGAGKSTLVSLLFRFYDPTRGQILLDGVDLRDYKLDSLRRQFAIVLQEPVLFSTSIAENIAYARPEASEEEIITAAKHANAHDFIVHLPDGYETRVGERGLCLSGGERQRISLARAFLKDAPILVLDEPTSSVDTKTEAVIIDAMERLMAGRTAIMIAHRLNTIERCNMILTLEAGRVASIRSANSMSGGASPASRSTDAGSMRREANV